MVRDLTVVKKSNFGTQCDLLFIIDSIMDAQSKQEDIARNCRCCFRLLINNAKILKINPLIEFKFYELTQIKVRFFFNFQKNYAY